MFAFIAIGIRIEVSLHRGIQAVSCSSLSSDGGRSLIGSRLIGLKSRSPNPESGQTKKSRCSWTFAFRTRLQLPPGWRSDQPWRTGGGEAWRSRIDPSLTLLVLPNLVRVGCTAVRNRYHNRPDALSSIGALFNRGRRLSFAGCGQSLQQANRARPDWLL